MALFDTIRAGASGAASAYEVQRSLRFNHPDSAYLQFQPSSDGNRQKWTWSGWVKRVRLGSTTYGLFTSQNNGDGGGNNGIASIYFGSDDKIHTYYDTTSGDNYGAINDAVYRDISAWYHIVWQVDAANQTSKIFVNGVQQTIASGSQPIGGYSYTMNQSGKRMTYGIDAWDLGTPASIYMAECHYSDGQLYDADVFAETDSDTGQWVPKASPVITYGTNGHYLNFSDNSGTTATTLGKDYSGNGNNFTPNNFSVSAGAGNDSVEDTPTNNFCVMNPLDMHSSMSTKNGNLQVGEGNDWRGIKGTFGVSSGKWYYEFKTGNANIFCGWAADDLAGTNNISGNPQDDNSAMSAGVLIFCDNGKYQLDTGGSGTRINYSSALAVNDVLGCAIDLDNNTAQFYKQGSALGSIDISSSKLATKKVMPYFICHPFSNPDYTFNFGQQAFAYTPPTGYKALCSANLPDPTILLPNKHFDTVLYSGNGSQNRAISGLEFQPDWVWLKSRNNTYYHQLHDAVRGTAAGVLYSNRTDAEDSTYGLASFNSNGFTVYKDGNNDAQNDSGKNYVAWNWNAGGSTVTNSSGTISAQVRTNATAGLSILTYSGNGSSGATVGHGLGVKPDSIIIKCRSNGDNWMVYHQETNSGSSPEDFYLELNAEGSQINDSRMMNDTAPTSTVFSLRADGSTNSSGRTYVAYCFSSVSQFSKFGKYKGNGSNDGTFVFTGFKVSFLICKKTSGSGNWGINDAERDFNSTYGNDASLYANSSGAETTSSSLNVDFLSNGFKLRSDNSSYNGSGGSFIYFAFAEAPFKNARAR